MSPYVPLCPHTSPPPVVPPGVVRALHSEGRVARLLCTETRPFLQGARLTALEMLHEGVPTTLIADSAAAAAIRERGVHGEGGRTEGGGWGGGRGVWGGQKGGGAKGGGEGGCAGKGGGMGWLGMQWGQSGISGVPVGSMGSQWGPNGISRVPEGSMGSQRHQ